MSFSTSGLSMDAVGQLYTGHHRWLLGWLHRRVGCRDQAADLAQDTFVKVLRGRDSLYLDEARALLSTIARSIVVDHFRRRALEQAFLDALALIPEPQAPSPEARSLVLEALLAVDRMLDGLPDKVRRAFLLSQLDGMGYRDIAVTLGVSVSSVQQYMTRAYAACYAALYADEA